MHPSVVENYEKEYITGVLKFSRSKAGETIDMIHTRLHTWGFTLLYTPLDGYRQQDQLIKRNPAVPAVVECELIAPIVGTCPNQAEWTD